MMHYVYQSQQITQLEQLAEQTFGISADVLMQRAGKSACEFLLKNWPNAKNITVICGAGNNGGDGYVVALCILKRGLTVRILQVGDHSQLKGAAQHAYQACKNAGVKMQPFSKEIELNQSDVIVDAILGIGMTGKLRENMQQIIEHINEAQIPKLAIDVPSGVNADTGYVDTAICADATITFLGLKLGLLTGEGVGFAGKIICDDLQLPVELYQSILPALEVIPLKKLKQNFLKKRPRHWHKGNCGHVLVIGGDHGYKGAAQMAAEAALRVGAGLVSVATRADHANLININHPEIMCHAIENPKDLESLFEKANVTVIGPGLGTKEWGKKILKRCLQLAAEGESHKPTSASHSPAKVMVVDADALNLMAEEKKVRPYANWILTPHPGEAGRLLKQNAAAIQSNRLAAIEQIQKKYGGVCVLKGAGSLVKSNDTLAALCVGGNPGMATAGMGDILSGVLGGLAAQGIPLFESARIGVAIHAEAGDQAASQSGERGMIATDLLVFLRKNVN